VFATQKESFIFVAEDSDDTLHAGASREGVEYSCNRHALRGTLKTDASTDEPAASGEATRS
jgi:hypothetical protein